MSCSISHLLYIVIIMAVIILAIGVSMKEGYGGPVKAISHLDPSKCKLVCDNLFTKCSSEEYNQGTELCYLLYNSCISECYMSDFQRV